MSKPHPELVGFDDSFYSKAQFVHVKANLFEQGTSNNCCEALLCQSNDNDFLIKSIFLELITECYLAPVTGNEGSAQFFQVPLITPNN